MKKSVLAIAALALTITGCASDPAARQGDSETQGFTPFSRLWLIRNNPVMAALLRPVRLFPIVFVEDSQIIVDQEPIHVRSGEGVGQRVKIEWSIGDAGYFFPDDNSVVFNVESALKPTEVRCDRGQSPFTTFTCRYRRPAGKAKYSYIIKVSDGTTTYKSDPYIVND